MKIKSLKEGLILNPNMMEDIKNIKNQHIQWNKISKLWVLVGVAQWVSAGLQTKGSQVQFPVRAHA